MKERVVVLGASPKEDRYSYKAVQKLAQAGHIAVPIHPAVKEIQGIPVLPRLSDVEGKVDTVTIYVNPKRLEGVMDELIALKPGRIILNPGTESDLAEARFSEAGIRVQRACTLVLLTTHQF